MVGEQQQEQKVALGCAGRGHHSRGDSGSSQLAARGTHVLSRLHTSPLKGSGLEQFAGVFLGCNQKMHFSLFHFFIETKRTLKLQPQQTNKLTSNDFPSTFVFAFWQLCQEAARKGVERDELCSAFHPQLFWGCLISILLWPCSPCNRGPLSFQVSPWCC